MNPLAIALQGVGFGALLVAVQGFAAIDVVAPVLPIVRTASSGGSGAQISMSDWLARSKKRSSQELEPVDTVIKKRQAQEDELLAMGIL